MVAVPKLSIQCICVLYTVVLFNVLPYKCSSETNTVFKPECVFPKQYEGLRLESLYMAEDDQFVAVDCGLQKVYKRSIVNPSGVYSVTDKSAGKIYFFFAPGVCRWIPYDDSLHMDKDECRVPEDFEFTGETFFDGRIRHGWFRVVGPTLTEQTEVVTMVTVDQDGWPGCLPFMSRVKQGSSVIAGRIFYEVRRGISDPSIFDIEVDHCKDMNSDEDN